MTAMSAQQESDRMNVRSITVIMPTYNRSQFLPDSINSLLHQHQQVLEILVIDDGSTDDTEHVVKSFDSDKIVYVKRPHGGKSAALNYALTLARGDLIWFFDDDDVALPDATAHHLKNFTNGIDFSYSPCYFFKGDPGSHIDLAAMRRADVPADDLFFKMLFVNQIVFQASIFDRRCFDAVGPFRTDLKRSLDYDMGLRLARRFSGRATADPTCCIREHDGLRGGEGNRFVAGRKIEVWYEHNKNIFNGLLDDLALHEYLPRARQALYPGNKREALLAKYCVASTHGIWTKAIDSLAEIAKIEGPLNPEETALIENNHVSNFAIDDLCRNRDIVRDLARLCRAAHCRPVSKHLNKALYWDLHRCLTRKERRRAAVRAETMLLIVVFSFGRP